MESVYCALLSLIKSMAKRQGLLRVVDFGSGSGNATLAVAWLLRDRCSFVLLDMKPVAVKLAESRVAAVPGLSGTVSAAAGRIEDYSDDFDIGVAVHACGMATDYAQLQCISRRVPYLLVPCCVGKINIDVSLGAGSRYAYPCVELHRVALRAVCARGVRGHFLWDERSTCLYPPPPPPPPPPACQLPSWLAALSETNI